MRSRTRGVRPSIAPAALAAVLVTLVGGPAAAQDPQPDFDERGANAFFADPDQGTRKQIEELIHRFASDGVRSRWRARRELERIGFWTVGPLIESVGELEPQVKCASILTLEAIGDRRAVGTLRGALLENAPRPYVPGFAALALGRFRDGDAVLAFSRALDSRSTRRTLRVAVPLALARIHTDAARDVLLAQLKPQRARHPEARQAQYMALGFFPSAALDADQSRPGDDLAAGLKSAKSSDRAAALLGFLVATVDRRDTLDFVRDYTARQKAPEVIQAGLLGISRHDGTDVTQQLARVAADGDKLALRVYAADLLSRRGDPAAKPFLLRALRRGGNRRHRAALVLALGSIEERTAVDAVVGHLSDASAIVRATAALACAHFRGEDARQRGLEAIEKRLRTVGDKSPGVRRTLRSARAVLSGELSSVRWSDPRIAYAHPIFRSFDRSYEERLLAAVNLQIEECLDLAKVQNLAGDTEVSSSEAEASAAPAQAEETEDDGEDSETVSDASEDEGEEPAEEGPGIENETGTTQDPDVTVPSTETDDRPSSGTHYSVGKSRTAPWHELRDLKIHLRQWPYFTLRDLPRGVESTTPR